MKLKNKFSLILASSLVALSSISCENKNFSNLLNETKNKENIDFSSKAVGSDILKDDDIKCKDEANLGFKTKALDDLPPTPPEANLSNGSAGPSISFADQPPPAPPPYSTELPVPENLTEGSITLVFKDEFKIRIKKEDSDDKSDKSDEDKENNDKNDKNENSDDKKFETKSNNENEKKTEDNDNGKNDVVKFKSLIQEDGKNENEPLEKKIEKLNKLMKDFNIKASDISISSMTEKEASEREKFIETEFGYDTANNLSRYSIKLKNKAIKVFIDKLRLINLVRESNFNYPATSDFTPNDNIFSNNSTITLSDNKKIPITNSSNNSDESLRYWYSRVDAYRAWDIVRAKGIIPAKVAVIDDSFIMNHADSPDYDYSIAMRCSHTSGCECNNPNICSTPLNINNLKYNATLTAGGELLKDQHGESVASIIGAPINSFGISGLAVNPDILGRKFIIPIKSPILNEANSSAGDVLAIDNIIKYNTLNPLDPIRVINIIMNP